MDETIFVLKEFVCIRIFLFFWKIDMDSVKKKEGENIIILLLKGFQKFK